MVDSKETTYERVQRWLRDQPVVVFLLFIFAVVVALGAFTDALDSIFSFARSFREEKAVADSLPPEDEATFPPSPRTLNHFDLNEEIPKKFEVGLCPGERCYRFEIGPEVVSRKGESARRFFLSGGGFVKRVSRFGADGVLLSGLLKQRGIHCRPDPSGRAVCTVPFYTGFRLDWIGLHDDVVLVVEDDRRNSLRIGVALYPGTFCKLVPGRDFPPGTPVPSCP